MAKKNFDTQSTLDKFFTQSEQDKHNTPSTHNKSEKHNKQGRPPKAEEEKLRGYRYNLNLDRDLKDFLHEMAWRKRTSITQYLNDLIREDMAKKVEAGEWEQGEK